MPSTCGCCTWRPAPRKPKSSWRSTLLLEAGRTPTFEAVRELAGSSKPATAPAIAKTTIDLSDYDTLLTAGGKHG